MSDGESFDQLLKGFQKEFGKIGGRGFDYPEVPRLPTGWFPLDLALGGGIPLGKIMEVYGMEGCLKTTLAYKLIANHQRQFPKKKCAFFAIEDAAYDKKRAEKMGVDTDALYVIEPDYGESAIDMVEDLLGSPECGIVVFDSLAALLTTRELSKSAETRDVGGPAFLVTQLMRKVVGGIVRARKLGNHPTFIGINQLRSKIGAYGPNPEDTAGGRALKYMCSTRLRLYAKDEKDAKYHKFLPVRKSVNFGIKKSKFPIVATSGTDMKICMIPYKGLKVGECDDFKLLCQYMMEHDILKKDAKDKWEFDGKVLGNLKDLKVMFDEDPDTKDEVCTAIIDIEKDKANREEGFEDTKGDDGEEDSTEEEPEDEDRKGKKKKPKSKSNEDEGEEEE